VVVSNFAPGTDANQVTIQWTEPTETGGTPLLDYEIYYALPTEDFQVLQSGVTDLYYLAEDLTSGLIYSFKVRARNMEGYGEFST
jgi:hypothetical protein